MYFYLYRDRVFKLDMKNITLTGCEVRLIKYNIKSTFDKYFQFNGSTISLACQFIINLTTFSFHG